MGFLRAKVISYTVGFRQSKNVPFRLFFFSTGLFWFCLFSSIESIFIVFVLILEAVGEGELLYGSRKSGVNSISVLRAFSTSNACPDEPSSKRIGGVGLRRKPPKLRPWRCTQPRAAKATAGIAVVGEMASLTRATAVM